MNQRKSTGLASIINSIVSKFELAFDSSDLAIPKSDHYVLCLVDGLAYNSFLEHSSSTCFLSSFNTKQTLRSGFEPYRVCRRVNILRDYPDDKTKLYPRN